MTVRDTRQVMTLRWVPVAVVMAAVISAATLAAGLLEGPGGVIGTVLAATACVVLAMSFTPGGDDRPH